MRTSTLDAVNDMLTSIGERPVNALGSAHPDAAIAEFTLAQVNRQVQAKGWYFNSETSFTILPDVAGEIIIPGNALSVNECSHSPFDTLTIRGDKFYDTDAQSFNIGKPVEVDIIVLLEFEELPEAARTYISMRASRRFQAKVVGNQQLAGYTEQDERMAWADVRQAEESARTNTILTQPGANTSTTRGVGTSSIFNTFGV